MATTWRERRTNLGRVFEVRDDDFLYECACEHP